MDPKVQQRHIEATMEVTLKQLALDASLKMADPELRVFSIWVWTGYLMHLRFVRYKKGVSRNENRMGSYGYCTLYSTQQR